MTTATPELQARVMRPADLKSHDRGGGARTTPLVSPAIGAAGFINGITEFAPGAAIAFHSHNCEESVVLLEGGSLDGRKGLRAALEKGDRRWTIGLVRNGKKLAFRLR